MRWLLWLSERPAVALALIGLATGLLALQLPRLRVDISTLTATLRSDPERQHYERYKRTFDRGPLTVVVVKGDDVFTPRVLGALRRLSDAIADLPGVTRVQSLTTVRTIGGSGDVLSTGPLIGDVMPQSLDALERLRIEVLDNSLLVGTLVSPDARTAAININSRPDIDDAEFNERLSAQLDRLIAREAVSGLTVYHTGDPTNRAVIRRHILRDLLVLNPVALAVILVALLATLRILQAVLIPVATEAIGSIWALGLMAIAGIPLTALTATVPALVVAIGFAEDVHMLSSYFHSIEAGDEKSAAIRRMLRKTAFPALVTSGTTAVGFASLAATDVPMLVQLGIAASLAFAADLLVTLVVVPACLALAPIPRRLRRVPLAYGIPSTVGRVIALRIGTVAMRRRGAVVLGAALLFTASVAAWYALRVDNDFLGFVREHSSIRQRVNDLHASMGGSRAFSVLVDGHRDGALYDPDVLAQIAELQSFLMRTGAIDKTVSIVDHLRRLHRLMSGGNPPPEPLPASAEQIAQYLLFLEDPDLSEYVDFALSTAHVVVRHRLTHSSELAPLLRDLDDYIARHAGSPATMRYTGEEILVTRTAQQLVTNELVGFFCSILAIALIHTWILGSLWASIVSLLPNVVPAVSTFGLMGLLGAPLDFGTASIASVSLGIAVDDTVHFLMGYQHRIGSAPSQEVAILDTLALQGPTIMSLSLAFAAGFATLASSSFTHVVHFGLFSAFAMLVAMVCELTITPALLSWLPPPLPATPASPRQG